MCGVAAIVGGAYGADRVATMLKPIRHRGPDGKGIWADPEAAVALGHRRLSIIDLSSAGQQPMVSADERYVIAFNGEVYNYEELRSELNDYPFRSRTDTEVVLAAWARWGSAALERMIGMFAFVVWDRHERCLFAVRDRLGIKPLYVATLPDGAFAVASEIKALHAGGVLRSPDIVAWATYLAWGQSDYSMRTFWDGVQSVPAGNILRWTATHGVTMTRWYDLAERVGIEFDERRDDVVREEYFALLLDSVRLRFRSDVPVGINLSGGVDSSALLGLVHAVKGRANDTTAFTFTCNDGGYDELPWVSNMLASTQHPLEIATLRSETVPQIALEIARIADAPYGGLPTLAYAALFRAARARGVLVLLDGQGLDEQWAGYDYYQGTSDAQTTSIVQGTRDPVTRPSCMTDELATHAERFSYPTPFPDRLRNLQLRDVLYTKLPRALRFNDRISMASSTELRDPFLDHRLFELALRQPQRRKIADGVGKVFLRELIAGITPKDLRLAPKRAMQTPQREWLRGPLRVWATEYIESALSAHPAWPRPDACRHAWREFLERRGDNSFWVWQWISLGLVEDLQRNST